MRRSSRSDGPSPEATIEDQPEASAASAGLPRGYDDEGSPWYVAPECRPHYTTDDADLEHVPSEVMRLWPIRDTKTTGRPTYGPPRESTRPSPATLKILDSFPYKLHELRLNRAQIAAKSAAAAERRLLDAMCECCGELGSGTRRNAFVGDGSVGAVYVLCRPCFHGLRRCWDDDRAARRSEPYLQAFYEQVRPAAH